MDMRSTLLQRLIQTQIEIFGIDAFWSAFWELCKVDVLYVPEFRQQIIEEGAWRDLILKAARAWARSFACDYLWRERRHHEAGVHPHC